MNWPRKRAEMTLTGNRYLSPESTQRYASVELAGQGEDHVEVSDGQDALLARLEPARLVEGLALGAMPVGAGVGRGLHLVAAVEAHVHMPAERLGTAGLDTRHDLPLLGRQRVSGAVCLPVRPGSPVAPAGC
jgi:hypothetical protein